MCHDGIGYSRPLGQSQFLRQLFSQVSLSLAFTAPLFQEQQYFTRWPLAIREALSCFREASLIVAVNLEDTRMERLYVLLKEVSLSGLVTINQSDQEVPDSLGHCE
jgi:hypothetical protein